MASLLDFYAPPPGNVAFSLGDIALERERAVRDNALLQSTLQRRLTTRTLPDLASSEAASGRFYSGGARVRATRAVEDVGEETGRANVQLQDVLSELQRRALFTNLGI